MESKEMVSLCSDNDEKELKRLRARKKEMKEEYNINLQGFESRTTCPNHVKEAAPKAPSRVANKPSPMEDQEEGANGLKEGSSSQPTIAKASIVDKFVSIKNYMDSNSCEANEANKQTPYEWTEDFESDDDMDEVLYHKEISLEFFCMHTWNSERTSPLAFDARQNRVLHQATLASSSVRIDLEGAPLDNFEGENFEKSFESDVEVEEVEIVNMAKGIDTYFRPGSFEDPSPVVYRTGNFHVQNMNQGRQGELSLEQKIEQIVRSQADMMELLRKNEQKAEINSKSMAAIGIQVGQLADERSIRPTPIPTEGVMEDYVSDEEEDPMTGVIKNATIPYPSALENLNSFPFGKQGSQHDDIWETFKQVRVNIPLIDAIKQIPAYAKFLKDMYSLKRCHKKVDSIAHVSISLINSLPLKYKDPGAPLISIEIGNFKIKRALLDLGDSVNILLESLYGQHNFGPL
ncbi:hypothetical protein Tco_1530269 [Tanacetum coccineum]